MNAIIVCEALFIYLPIRLPQFIIQERLAKLIGAAFWQFMKQSVFLFHGLFEENYLFFITVMALEIVSEVV